MQAVENAFGPGALGTDISGWQSVKGCDWGAAAEAGERFTILKLSQGFKVSRKGLKHAAKLRQQSAIGVGAYHFADPLRRGFRVFNPEDQADVFIAAIREAFPDGAIGPWVADADACPRWWLDIEWKSFGKTAEGKARGKQYRRQFPADRVVEWVRRFCGRFMAVMGEPIGIYTGRSYVRYRMGSAAELAHYPLWRAAYGDVGEDRTQVPSKRPGPIQLDDGVLWPMTIWQFTGRGSCRWYRKGKGKIDRNLLLPRGDA